MTATLTGPATRVSGRSVVLGSITRHRRDVGVGVLLTSGHQAGEASVPVLIGVVLDTAVGTGSISALAGWIGVLAAVFVGLSYAYRFGSRAAERASELAAHDLRLQVTRRVLDPHGGPSAGNLAGELTNIVTGDAWRVGAINLAVPFGVAALVALLVAAFQLLRVSVPLGLLVLLGTPPLLLATHFIGKPLERRTEDEQDRAAVASGVAADLVGGLRVLKGIGAENAAVTRYRRTSQDSLLATLRAARAVAANDGLVLMMTGLFIALIALVGGRLATEGQISIGELVAAVGLALFLLEPMSMFAVVNAEAAQARASATRIADLLNTAPAVVTGPDAAPDPVRGELRLRGVRHAELDGLDLVVAPGELLGVVVPSPSVAAALLACLSRDVDPAAGAVELDGVSLTAFGPEQARAAIVVARHDADLFAGSLAKNVCALRATPDAVDRALAAAVADEVAAALPDGTDGLISERGSSLSGGQRQRVALARALATEAPVLVLHDPTTAVDAVTEGRIAAALRETRRDRTTVVLTTSPALLDVTDRVVLVEAGGVRLTGSHDELLHADEAYRSAVLS